MARERYLTKSGGDVSPCPTPFRNSCAYPDIFLERHTVNKLQQTTKLGGSHTNLVIHASEGISNLVPSLKKCAKSVPQLFSSRMQELYCFILFIIFFCFNFLTFSVLML
jgi:hypothetical protein